MQFLITHIDDSCGSKALSCICVWVSVSVCLRNKTKMAETTIIRLATGIVHHESRLPI